MKKPRFSLPAALSAASKSIFPSGLTRLRSASGLWIETTLIVVLSVAISLLLSRQDPFGIRAEFPWLLLATLIVAMRYGSVLGIYAMVLITACWYLLPELGLVPKSQDFPKTYFLGGLVVALVAGQFADIWNSRLEKVKEVNAYLDERLTGLTRQHYLLRLSHERIEQDLLIRPTTLRDLLMELRDAMVTETGDLPGSKRLLGLLAQSCEIETAGIFLKRAEGTWETKPIAQVAEVQDLLLSDPLVQYALEHKSLAHPQASADLDDSRYLAVAPIVTANRRVLGLLAIERMPFFGLNNENLQLMLVLCGYFADGVESAKLVKPIIRFRPQCPPDFALELVRLQRLAASVRIASALVALTVENHRDNQPTFEHIKRQRRTADPSWESESETHNIHVTLLTLAAAANVEGYLARIEESMRAQLNTDFTRSRIGIHVAMLSEAEPEWALDDLLNRAGLRAPMNTQITTSRQANTPEAVQ